MAIKAISQFDAATPTSNDKILFEQNGEGKSTALSDLPVSRKTQDALNTKVNTANVLTYEEIMATTDLTGKVASANAIKKISIKEKYFSNYTTDSAGNIYIEMDTANYFVLSAATSQQYICNIAIYGDGSKYYVKVFDSNGALAPGITITSLYVHYVER